MMANKGFWVTVDEKTIHVQGDPDMNDEDLDVIIKLVQSLTNGEIKKDTGTSLDFPRDLGFECSMCGKPMEYRYCGMCTHCEMVWNG